MNGSVSMNGNTLLSGGLTVNTDGVVEPIDINITENGDRTITAHAGVDGYNPITIHTNVPQQTDPILDDITITENGNYTPPSGTDGYDEITVNVPQLEPVLDDITITENGTYTPPSGVDGYDEITVNVSQDADIQPLTRTITTNGTTVINASELNVDGFDPVTITTAVDGYTIKTLANTPLPIASFNDGTDNPFKSLTASIVPVQSGSGDPSPTNVRPISGWTEEVITRCGKNLVEDVISGWYITANGTFNVGYNYDMQIARVMKGKTYTVTSNEGLVAGFFVNKPTSSSTSYNGSRVDVSNKTFIAPIDGYVAFRTEHNYATSQCELGSTPTTYEPYNGHTYTIPFTDSQGNPVEVYGGSVDVVDGVVTPCPYYASYNGEELTGEWISDRDVYSPNTTPTIGAQVVNIGATGTPFSVQPTAVKSLDGENNVFASTGDVEELKYFADL